MNIYLILWCIFTLGWVFSIVILGINFYKENKPAVKIWNIIQIVFAILMNIVTILYRFSA
jgi:hypothetical protein